MKKILLGLFALSSLSFAQNMYFDNMIVKVGSDFSANYESVYFTEQSITKEALQEDAKSNGYEISLEFLKDINDNLKAGIGIAYQKHGDRKSNGYYIFNLSGVEYDSYPVYGTIRYDFNMNSNVIPYVKANLGYSFNKNPSKFESEGYYTSDTSVTDGIYYAFGGGLEYNNLIVELMYGVNKAESECFTRGQKVIEDNDYERFTLSLGYNFNL
ncbi:MAG: outer membrane beta-barrel protein [Fusobacterium sp. JB021]|nr:outer membrane beta-barrel protein [Fusobacterium sp. JB021]MDP0505793.1 outer membrane beta-barrel protein [Fusobacterium sp. JB019]